VGQFEFSTAFASRSYPGFLTICIESGCLLCYKCM